MKSDDIKLKQIREIAEWFGFETRNKYQLCDKNDSTIGYAAEQQKGFLGFIMRQFLGHWRSFDIHLFNVHRQHALTLRHPFRWFFQKLEIMDESEKRIGSLQQRFSLLYKSFDVEDSEGRVLFEVRSPIWRIWTFTFMKRGREVSEVQKKWSGFFSEMLTDRDNFVLTIKDQSLTEVERLLMISAGIYIDLQYFEKKASSS